MNPSILKALLASPEPRKIPTIITIPTTRTIKIKEIIYNIIKVLFLTSLETLNKFKINGELNAKIMPNTILTINDTLKYFLA
ncbi:hypothetical protein SDC9_176985 [bioreactor metagenome]|uniref:Uncharacterized protein n=1 Tax=bioreactor metagenome TaxID=1076179 RepID=A0A645GU72_9ZZZZ